MSQSTIRALLESRLKTWATARSPALTIAFQNAEFQKPATGAHLRVFLLPNTTDSRFLDNSDRDYTGIFQVSIVAPLNGGPKLAETIVGELEALFPEGLLIVGALTVRITSVPSAGPADTEPNAYVVPVTIEYRAQVIS